MTKKQVKIFEIFFALILLALYVYMAASNVNAVLNWFLTDDAFYYFQVARNVSEGAGFSYDDINLSNGFHPLWMFVCIPIFSLARFNLILPLRVMIIVLGLFHISSFILLFRLLKRFLAEEIAVLFSIFWGFSPIILEYVYKGGVESAINAFFIILLWERMTKFNLKEKLENKDLKQIFILGLIGALTILSRLDNVFLVFFVGIWLWLKYWYAPDKEKDNKKEQWLWRFKTGAAFNGIIVFLISTYLAWNKIVFGEFMPISGKVKLWWGILPNSVYGKRLGVISDLIKELFSEKFSTGPWALLVSNIHKLTELFIKAFNFSTEGDAFTSAVWKMMAFIATFIILLIILNKKKFFDLVIKLGIITLFFGTLLQAAYYKGYGSVVQRPWYWVGEFIFIVIIVAVLVALVYSMISKWNWVSKAILLAVIAVSVWLPVKSTRNFQAMVAGGRKQRNHEYLYYAEFMEENFDHGTVMGLTGPGVWGYFAENYTFINLDGLINSKQYFEMLKDGTAAELLAENGLEYVMGSKYIITESNPYGKVFNGHLKEINLRYRDPNTHMDIWEFIP